MKKSIFLFFAAILCAIGMNAAVPSKLYLDASGWGYSDARYAAYFMPQNSFVDMTKATGEVSVFEVAVPASQTKVIFVRMDGSKPANDWANKWNQTGDLVIPTDGKNKFTPSGWDGATTTWSTYTPPTFYIAGDFVTPTWSENAAANKMDYADGVYSKSYNNVAASAHQFKITNGTWTNAIGYDQNKCSGTNCTVENGGGNIKFTPLAEGTVTITFTPTDGKIHITCPEPPAAEFNITYPATQTNYTLVAGPAKAQTGAEVSFTATPAEGYVLNVTYNGNVIAGENNVYTFMMPASDVTIAITAVAATTLYYVDNNNWGNVNAYMWSDHGNNGWPGAVMALVGTVGDNAYSYYSISFAQGAYTSIIFNGGGSQTGDLTINTAKPYFYDGAWYTWDELLAKLAAPVVTYDYYIAGTEKLTGYNWKENGLGMEKDGELYKATFTELNADEYEFKITDGQWNTAEDKTHEWGYNNLGAAYEEVSQGTDGEGNPNGNIKFVTEEAKNITVIFDPATGKITFEGLTLYVVPLTYTVTVPAGTEKCYIAGAFAQSNWNTFVEMTKVGDEDKFTIEIVGAKETDEYKYACQADWAYAEVIDGGGNRTNWSELDEVTAWGKPVIVTYELKGVGGWDQPGIELVQNPGNDKEYMLTCQAISATDAIKVVRLEDGVIKDYYGNGTVKEGVEVTVNYDTDGNITLPEGKYNFYFDTAEPEKKLWIAAATDCVTEPTTVTLNYDLTTDAVTNKMGRRYVTAEDATLGEVQIILPYFSAETTEYAEAFLIVGSETLDATATYAADAENNLEVYTATATSEDGATIYNVTMNVTVPATQEYTFLATNGAEYVTEDWGEEGEPFIVYMISGEGYLNDETVAFDMSVDQMGNLEATINDVYVMGTATNLVEEEGYLWLAGTANDEGGNTYNIEMNVAQAVEEVEIVITDEVNVTLGYLNLEVMGNMAMVTAGNEELPLSFWLTLLETENYYGSYGADMFSNIWYGDNQLQPYGDGTYNQNGLVVSFISEPDEAGNATKYNFTLKKDEIYSRAVTNQWGTICLPFGSNNYTGAEFYELVQAKADGVVLASVETLEAGVPYIFKATATELAVYSDGTTVTEAGNHNGLYGTFTDNTEVTEGNYILKDNAICEVAATCYVNKNRAYVVMSEVPTEPVQQMPGRRYIGLDVHGENGTTGLDNIMTTDAPVKAIALGQVPCA